MQELGEALSLKYVSGNRDDGSAGQLAVLFSLLPGGQQPLPLIKTLLRTSSGPLTPRGGGTRAAATSIPGTSGTGDAGLDLSILQESPTALLPDELRPFFDKDAQAFFVPGLSSLDKRGEALLAFGTRGPFPISKVTAWCLLVGSREICLVCAAHGASRTMSRALGTV